MPDELQITGGITQALLDALNAIEHAVTAQLSNPDGSPSGTAVYMHLPIGQPVDPKMYANPWTPAGGSAYGAVTSTGAFPAPPPAAPAPGTPATPAGQVAQINSAPAPDPKLQLAISSAFNTSQRVDNMLMVTDKGVAKAWPQRTVSIEYFTALTGMQAEPVPEPSDEVKKRIADAQKTLYLMDADGNFTGYTPLYTAYRHNQKALADARSRYANAYAQAMSDPVLGQAFPIASAQFQNDVDQAYSDLKDMGGQRVEDAIATLQSQGGSAAAALIAKARKMFDEYNVGLGGAVAVKVPWSYIDPVSWWDPTNQDFGVMKIKASSQHFASSGGGQHSLATSFYNNSSSSTSGSAGFHMFGFGAEASAGHSTTEHNEGATTDQSQWSFHQDKSSSATIEFEWFIASIERPWLMGDLFHMDGWYLVGGRKNAISDGTIEGQLGDVPKLLPMIPKGFVVVRNVTITADSWGDMGNDFQHAIDTSSGHTEGTQTNWGGSVGWCGIGGSVQHSNAHDEGAFSTGHDANQGWSFESHGEGGTLRIYGAQIAGWIGQIQPAAPRKDDPNLPPETATTDTPAAAGTPTPEPVPAGQPA